jgi:hypothetical protein
VVDLDIFVTHIYPRQWKIVLDPSALQTMVQITSQQKVHQMIREINAGYLVIHVHGPHSDQMTFRDAPVGDLGLHLLPMISLLWFNVPAFLHSLMPLQCVFPSERLSTSFTRERFISRMGLPMAFQVMLSVERQRAHITGEGARWRCWILYRFCLPLRNILGLGLEILRRR